MLVGEDQAQQLPLVWINTKLCQAGKVHHHNFLLEVNAGGAQKEVEGAKERFLAS